MFNLLKFTDKSIARRYLREHGLQITKKSSYYLFANNIYIGLSTENPILYADYIINECEGVTQFIYDWCYTELYSESQFAEFENKAKVIQNIGAVISVDNQQIMRSFQPLTEIMLIINVTPDSFSDGGECADIDKTLENIEYSLQNGVSVIDIGAESTRPNADYVSIDEEIKRLQLIIPRIHELKQKYQFKLSLDSYKPEVIKLFLNEIDIINDVSNQMPIDIIKSITEQGKQYVLMHSLTVPANPEIVVDNQDVTNEMLEWFEQWLIIYKKNAINTKNIILDPGIGFNKTSEQSWSLLRNSYRFYELGCEVLIGHSRKRFLNNVTTTKFANRDLESAIVSTYLANLQIDYLRMHDYKDYLMINSIHQYLRNNVTIK